MPVQVKPMIAEAFIRLSKQKNIDKITVKDLVEACGISRQTFYYHFQDILEVIEWSLDQAFSHLLEQSLAADDPEAVLRGFLETSEESAELLQKLCAILLGILCCSHKQIHNVLGCQTDMNRHLSIFYR